MYVSPRDDARHHKYPDSATALNKRVCGARGNTKQSRARGIRHGGQFLNSSLVGFCRIDLRDAVTRTFDREYNSLSASANLLAEAYTGSRPLQSELLH